MMKVCRYRTKWKINIDILIKSLYINVCVFNKFINISAYSDENICE